MRRRRGTGGLDGSDGPGAPAPSAPGGVVLPGPWPGSEPDTPADRVPLGAHPPAAPVAAAGEPGDGVPLTPTAMERFRRSLPGAMLAAAMVGLGQVLEPKPETDEIVTVGETPLGRDDRFELHLDPEHRERSFVVIRGDAPDHA